MSIEGMKIKNLIQTCYAYPSQWEAETEDNRIIYIHYRHGVLRVGIGDTLSNAIDNSIKDSTNIKNSTFFKIKGDKFDGIMTTEKMLKETGLILEKDNETYNVYIIYCPNEHKKVRLKNMFIELLKEKVLRADRNRIETNDAKIFFTSDLDNTKGLSAKDVFMLFDERMVDVYHSLMTCVKDLK